MFALGDVHAIGRLVVVAGEDVVDVVDASGAESDFGEVGGPDSAVAVFGLVDGVVGGVDAVVDEPVPVLPLLVVVLLEVVVGGVDAEHRDHAGQLDLFVGLVQKGVVLLVDHPVAVPAVLSEHLEAPSHAPAVVPA